MNYNIGIDINYKISKKKRVKKIEIVININMN